MDCNGLDICEISFNSSCRCISLPTEPDKNILKPSCQCFRAIFTLLQTTVILHMLKRETQKDKSALYLFCYWRITASSIEHQQTISCRWPTDQNEAMQSGSTEFFQFGQNKLLNLLYTWHYVAYKQQAGVDGRLTRLSAASWWCFSFSRHALRRNSFQTMALPLLKRCYFGGVHWRQAKIWLEKEYHNPVKNKPAKHTKPDATDGCRYRWLAWQRTHCSAEVWPCWFGSVPPGASCPHAPALRDMRTCPRRTSWSPEQPRGAETGGRSAPPPRVASARPIASYRWRPHPTPAGTHELVCRYSKVSWARFRLL